MAIHQSRALMLTGLVILSVVAFPMPAQAAADGTSIFSGWTHNCVIKTNGNVYCWDSNGKAKVGYSGGDAVAGSAGYVHSCALRINGNVACWGGGSYGQSENYTSGNATQVAAGGFHTCVLKVDRNVDCYGRNLEGQSENYTGRDAIFVAAGDYTSCVIKSNGNAYCWGWLFNGDLYTGGDSVSIDLSDSYICLVKISKEADCNPWTFSNALKAVAGGSHACALVLGRNVECEADPANDYGQGADYFGGDAVDVSVGIWQTCILKLDGSVECRGEHADADYRVPPAPTGVAAVGGDGRITLSWNAVTGVVPGPVTYRVYRGETSGSETLVTSGGCANLFSWSTTCTDSGLGDGTTRYYRVRAVNDLGEGPLSAEVSATTNFYAPSEPQNFRYDTVQDRLLWGVPSYTGGSDPEDITYKMYRRTLPRSPPGCPVGPQSSYVCEGTQEEPLGPEDGDCGDLGNSLSCEPEDCPALVRCIYRVSAVSVTGQEGSKSPEVLIWGNDPT